MEPYMKQSCSNHLSHPQNLGQIDSICGIITAKVEHKHGSNHHPERKSTQRYQSRPGTHQRLVIAKSCLPRAITKTSNTSAFLPTILYDLRTPVESQKFRQTWIQNYNFETTWSHMKAA